jgi:hypothetical protein
MAAKRRKKSHKRILTDKRPLTHRIGEGAGFDHIAAAESWRDKIAKH